MSNMSAGREFCQIWSGASEAPWVIAEVGQAHDGSLGMAHSYIDAAAEGGADAIKFQMHIADEESSDREPWRTKFSFQDVTRFDYWRRMEFTVGQWVELRRHAEERGLTFLCSPFSLAAIRRLEAMDVAAWKVASGEVTNRLLLDAMTATGRPVLLSSGMSSLAELDEAVALIRGAGCPLGVFQCTTAYPCPPEKIGLNLLAEFASRFDCPVGLSDHSGTIFPSLAAVTLGAKLIEVHVVFSRDMFGPDAKSSLTFPQLKQLTDGVKAIHAMTSHPVVKDDLAGGMEELRQMFGQSLVAAVDLPAGTLLEKVHISCRKPGHGIPASKYLGLIGKQLNRAVRSGEFLALTDFKP